MPELTWAQWGQVIAYSLLVVFWLSVFVATIASLFFRTRTPPSRIYKRAHVAFLAVAGVFLFDSTYWAIANISRVNLINPAVEEILRAPVAVTAVKTTVLLAAGVFLWIVTGLGKDIRSRMESIYFHGLIDQTWDAIGILDANGIVRIWNSGAEQIFGFSRQYAQGKHINDFLVPPDAALRHETQRQLETAKLKRTAARYTQPRMTSKGEYILVEIVSSPIFDESGRFEGYFGIMRAAIDSRSPSGLNQPVSGPKMPESRGSTL